MRSQKKKRKRKALAAVPGRVPNLQITKAQAAQISTPFQLPRASSLPVPVPIIDAVDPLCPCSFLK